MDLAASIQAVTEEVVLRLGRSIRRESGQTNLCLAGGVALNCVANGRLKRENILREFGSSRRLETPVVRSGPPSRHIILSRVQSGGSNPETR
jgi:hypothetical protein